MIVYFLHSKQHATKIKFVVVTNTTLEFIGVDMGEYIYLIWSYRLKGQSQQWAWAIQWIRLGLLKYVNTQRRVIKCSKMNSIEICHIMKRYGEHCLLCQLPWWWSMLAWLIAGSLPIGRGQGRLQECPVENAKSGNLCSEIEWGTEHKNRKRQNSYSKND